MMDRLRELKMLPVVRYVEQGGPRVTVLGDYDHFQRGMLAPALDAVGVTHGPELHEFTRAAIVWNPWSLLSVPDLIPAGLDVPIVNGGRFHCSKRNVARRFAETFGYDLEVDPLTFRGPMVRKADENAQHDGITLDGPLSSAADVAAGQVYQRLIDNTFGPSVVDVRVSIARTVQAHCYVKLRPVGDRYSNVNSAAWFAPTATLLTPEEIDRVNAFARAVELDFGQLDMCRDNATGRIYVVDANNTPFGPANGMSDADKQAALGQLGEDFVREFGLFPADS